MLVTHDLPGNTSLNLYLRDHLGLKDVKFMCNEGGCGACIISASTLHPVSGRIINFAVNSVKLCLKQV